jgi:hypothetical protein
MNDIVTRLRDWRNVHLARLHILMEEAADEVARLRSDNNRRANLEQGLRDGIVRLSANGDCPVADNVANRDNTPATHDTPSEGREQGGCTLTDAEREAIESAIWDYAQSDDDEDCARMVATLERLLERTK